jgi:hypothetical protein
MGLSIRNKQEKRKTNKQKNSCNHKVLEIIYQTNSDNQVFRTGKIIHMLFLFAKLSKPRWFDQQKAQIVSLIAQPYTEMPLITSKLLNIKSADKPSFSKM